MTTQTQDAPHAEAHTIAPIMLTTHQVATLLACSPRTIYRLSRSGKMPPPVRLGSVLRWSRAAIDEWLAADCPAGRKPRHRK